LNHVAQDGINPPFTVGQPNAPLPNVQQVAVLGDQQQAAVLGDQQQAAVPVAQPSATISNDQQNHGLRHAVVAAIATTQTDLSSATLNTQKSRRQIQRTPINSTRK
jgi:hypothetical protein